MKTKMNLTALAVLCLIFFVFGCGKSDDNHRCLSSSEMAKLESPFTYGMFVQGKFHDNDAWHQANNCGWSIYNNHRGGYGGTLQIIKDGVILVWAYEKFNGFVLQPGWDGQTDKGLMIGDSLSDFFEIYPQAVRNIIYPKYRVFSAGANNANFYFNHYGNLEAIDIGYGYYRYYNSSEILDTGYVDLSANSLPGQWTGTIDIPGYTRVYKVEVPYSLQRNAAKDSYIRFNIRVISKGLDPVCVETIKIFDYNKVRDSIVECAPDYVSHEIYLFTDFDEYFEQWEYEKLVILISGTDNAAGDYEISIDCPDGSFREYYYGKSFCSPIN